MSLSDLQKRMLISGIEDYTGLWEVCWEVKALNEELSDSAVVSLAQEVVKKLLQQRRIELFWCNWPSFDVIPIGQAQREDILSNKTYWQASLENTQSVCYGTTDDGEKDYWASHP
jgi:hypothetical protein